MGNEYFYLTKETFQTEGADVVWLLRDVPLSFLIHVDVSQFFSFISISSTAT